MKLAFNHPLFHVVYWLSLGGIENKHYSSEGQSENLIYFLRGTYFMWSKILNRPCFCEDDVRHGVDLRIGCIISNSTMRLDHATS